MVHSMVKNMLKNFGGMKIMSTFASQTQKTAHLPTAKIAQLVEHDLAKVGVAGVVIIGSCEFESHFGHFQENAVS